MQKGYFIRTPVLQSCNHFLQCCNPAILQFCNNPPVDVDALRRDLESQIEGEVRFDKVSRALYSTDASVYQIEPLGVVVVKSRQDVDPHRPDLPRRIGCSLTMRGGGTSQAGQAIGPGLQVDTSKYFNRVLEVNAAERWARVEPGIVLDELNASAQARTACGSRPTSRPPAAPRSAA